MPEARLPVIALTVGEPAGIGPEISLRAAWSLRHEVRPVLIGDAAYLAMLANEIDPAIRLMAVSIEAVRITACPPFPQIE
jgi:4-hydroxythreonine-4-phosphate dehydrogenase